MEGKKFFDIVLERCLKEFGNYIDLERMCSEPNQKIWEESSEGLLIRYKGDILIREDEVTGDIGKWRAAQSKRLIAIRDALEDLFSFRLIEKNATINLDYLARDFEIGTRKVIDNINGEGVSIQEIKVYDRVHIGYLRHRV